MLQESTLPGALDVPLATDDQPRSPRQKLDALLEEEHVQPAPVSLPLPPTPAPARPEPSSPLPSLSPSSPSPSAALTGAMPPPSQRPPRPDMLPTPPSTAPRSNSIDSTAAANPAPSLPQRPPPGHGSRPSQDVNSANPPNMAALIAAAGSPEAAMMALWRDKQSTQSHNAQLWRLVEKQRAMVIGLQRDLERALKDKDRYRRKAKEALDQIPPIPGMKRSDTLSSIMERDQSASPAPGDRSDAPSTPVEYRNTPPPEQTATSEQALPPETHEPTVTQNQEQEQEQEQTDPHMYPESQLALSPTQSEGHSFSPTTSGAASQAHSPGVFAVKPLDFSVKAPAANVALQENSLDAQLSMKLPAPETPTLNLTASELASQHQPQLALTQPTPEMRGGAFSTPPRKPVHPLRKAPPAPLNLSKPMATSAHLHQATNDDSEDSDYDDTLEVEEIPVVVERGRRKTREEDDRVREAIVAKEEEARSKSAKQKSGSKGKASPANESDQTVPVPQSPRQLNLLQAGLPLSPRHPPAGSLNAMLSPAGSDTSMMANRSVGSLGSPPLLSPGLPTSPRPGDRPPGSPLPRHPKQSIASPPMSPTMALSPGARSLQQPVPLPPNTPQSYQSLPTSQAEKSISTKKSDLLAVPNAQPSPDSASSSPTLNDTPDAEHVYRGLVSDQYPGLLLPPNALPSIEVKVFSSRLRPSRLSFLAPRPHEEDPVFTLAVYARSDNKQLWRLEKTIATLPALDSQLKSLCDFQGKLPERVLFSGHAPAKIDARRAALTLYFDVMLETPMSEKAALIVCEFFSTDVIGAQMGDRLTPEPILAPTAVSVPKTRQNKEGYLTKRGKNFGGWKARYFVLDGPEFRYYEVEGGAHLGTIKLLNAQIGKQSQQQSNQSPQRRDDAEDNQYRHAFLILEPKRKDSASLVRHVLCAENDEERDVWVDALLQHVDWQDEKSPTDKTEKGSSVPARLQKPHGGQNASRSQSRGSPDVETMDRLQGIKYNDTIAAEAPVRGPNHRDTIGNKSSRESPKGTSFSHDNSSHYPVISAPSNGTRIRDAETWGNKPMSAPTSALPAVPTSIKDKKRSIFGFRGRGGSSDLAPIQIANHPLAGFESRTLLANRSIFGMTLQEAVDFSQAIGYNAQLPSVVYRSLEYLKAKNAISEEGIFRLSGSNIVIKALRERFNTEGDIKLLDGPYTDVHAIASLLKLYLRELPASILTRELHLDFLKVLDMDERSKKIQSFNVLVHKLPIVNFELLSRLSSFLIEIVDNSQVNKMTVRNVGIVFAPTLNIPAPLIAFFLTDFKDIFGTPLDEAASPIHEIRRHQHQLSDDAIRSPRRQMFSDIPTPGYNETSFPQRFQPQPKAVPPPSFPPPPPPQHQQQSQQQQYQQYQQSQQPNYESGFIPMKPSYNASQYDQSYQGGDGYGSLNSSVSSNSSRDQRQRRRESGMLLMNMGMGAPRKGSNGSSGSSHRPRDEPRGVNPLMVREETAFE